VERSSWQETVISGRPSFQARNCINLVFPHPVGPFNNSGNPFLLTDENGEVFNDGTIMSNMLENSNVSMTNALSELIVYQRSFEGAAKIITTSDEMIRNAIGMKK
jgi:flagellar hook protein FlgE